MRNLKQIREENLNCNKLLNEVIEEKPFNLSSVFRENEQAIYKNFVKPICHKTLRNLLNKK